jgi:hypothetical protein
MTAHPEILDLTSAEALARALHPERDARPGDWGARIWRQMQPGWQQAAIVRAAATIDELNRLGFDVVAASANIDEPSTTREF